MKTRSLFKYLKNTKHYQYRSLYKDVRIHTTTKSPKELRRSRIVYLSKWRGLLENSAILTSFTEKWINTLSDEELSEYEAVLRMNEIDLYKCLSSNPCKSVPEGYNKEIIKKIRQHICQYKGFI